MQLALERGTILGNPAQTSLIGTACDLCRWEARWQLLTTTTIVKTRTSSRFDSSTLRLLTYHFKVDQITHNQVFEAASQLPHCCLSSSVGTRGLNVRNIPDWPTRSR
jgi:hypothetical protein